MLTADGVGSVQLKPDMIFVSPEVGSEGYHLAGHGDRLHSRELKCGLQFDSLAPCQYLWTPLENTK